MNMVVEAEQLSGPITIEYYLRRVYCTERENRSEHLHDGENQVEGEKTGFHQSSLSNEIALPGHQENLPIPYLVIGPQNVTHSPLKYLC